MLFPLTEILLSPLFKKYLNLKITSLEVKVLVAQLCPTLGHPMDCSPPGFSVHGNLQARILEWVSISFSGDLPDPGIKPGSPASQADSLPTELLGKPMTNIDSILKGRDITLSTRVHIVKAMVFPVAMCRCESWTIKKAEC